MDLLKNYRFSISYSIFDSKVHLFEVIADTEEVSKALLLSYIETSLGKEVVDFVKIIHVSVSDISDSNIEIFNII